MVDLGHEQNNQIGMKEMATIRDIAKITGFSITTVSRVITTILMLMSKSEQRFWR